MTRCCRDRIARAWIEAEVLRLTNARAAANRKAGAAGPEGSVAKLAFAEIEQAHLRAVHRRARRRRRSSTRATRWSGPTRRASPAALDPRKMFLRSRAYSIEGGTSEILRNILGERVLGLPGEPRADKDLPWSQVPRS